MGIFALGLRPAPVRRVAARHGREHPGRRPVHLLRRTAQGRGDRLGRGLRPGVHHHPRGGGVPAQPAGHHQLRRVARRPPSSGPSPTWSATTPATWRWPSRVRSSRSSTPGTRVARLGEARRGAGHHPHPGGRVRRRGRPAVRHPGHPDPVAAVPGPERPPHRRPGAALAGPVADAGRRPSGAPWSGCTRTTSGSPPGPGPPTACCRRSTPTSTTRAPSEAPPGRSGTCSAPSTGTSADLDRATWDTLNRVLAA